MYARLSVLFFVCLLFLPSCQHSLGGPDGPDANGLTEFRYGTGSTHTRTEVGMIMVGKGKVGKMVPMMAYDARYSTKEAGERVAWDVTLENMRSFGVAKGTKPFYAVSFTTDARGEDMADKVVHETPVVDEWGLGEKSLLELGLPSGTFAIGAPSIPLPLEALQSKDMQIVFPEPSPAYVYQGVKEINGRECYVFAYDSKLTVKWQGADQPGAISISAAFTKQMLPVQSTTTLTISGIIKDIGTLIVCEMREITEADAKPDLPPEAQADDSLQSALERAPLQPVAEPVAFRYAPASAEYRSGALLQVAKKGKPALKIPLLESSLGVETAMDAERMAWRLRMADAKVMGQPLALPEPLDITFTSDRHGRDIREFKDNMDMNILSADDVQNDFVIPEGAYRSGDVCMPVRLQKKDSEFTFRFPEEQGFVFRGMKEVGSLRVVMLTADIDSFVAKNKNTGLESQGRLSLVRYYDLATMLPLWFDGVVSIDLGDSVLTTSGGMVRNMD
ncbi:hypothetical protein [Desulfovibrio sp. Huiquan2017]|uniref:hypothetical protein n=1 Tax=Desulfovibrio sp. Huiquan2017 TaxID=2816861 RepID=UPI001A929282|nr:hypothetical protein [Desulfovibrio sp. Huiquan2017]